MDETLRYLIEKDRIIDVLNRLFIATDRRDWDSVRDCLAATVLLDMTSLTGGEPVRLTGAQVAEGWETGLRAIEALHHQAGNYRVTVRETEASAFCYGIALHYRKTRSGRNTRTFVGSYDVHFRREPDAWRIDRFAFHAKYVDGNLELEKES